MTNNRLLSAWKEDDNEKKEVKKETAKRGRKKVFEGATKKVALTMTLEDVTYLRLRIKALEKEGVDIKSSGSVSECIAYLVSKDKEQHPDIAKRANKILALEEDE